MSEEVLEKKQENLQQQNNDESDIIVEEALNKPEVKAVIQEIAAEFSGPIPPPSLMAGYEKLLPGAADRILCMAEKQSDHRQKMEMELLRSDARDSLLGIIFAFVLSITCLVAGVLIVFLNNNVGAAVCGSLLGVSGIASITGVFLKYTRKGFVKKEESE